MAKYLLRGHSHHEAVAHADRRNPFVRLQLTFENNFEKLRGRYRRLLMWCVAHRVAFTICFLLGCLASFALLPWLGEDFFPAVDSGQMRLHVRARTGTRIEHTAKLCDVIENSIRRIIPATELENILDNIGLPYSNTNTSYANNGTLGPADADVMVTLLPKHHPTANYMAEMRRRLPDEFPGIAFYFLPADLVGQVLNFGLPAPIDIQIIPSGGGRPRAPYGAKSL